MHRYMHTYKDRNTIYNIKPLNKKQVNISNSVFIILNIFFYNKQTKTLKIQEA